MLVCHPQSAHACHVTDTLPCLQYCRMAKATHFVQSGFMKAVSIFFEYDTPKIVHIRSKKVGVINRLIQIVLLAYIIG